MNKLLESENFHLTNKSGNIKTGKMAVSTSSRKTCDAKSCVFHKDNGGGCYAESGYHLRMHWDKITSGARGVKWDLFLEQLKKLKKGSELRINQAGDIVLDDLNNISQKYLNGIIESTKHLAAVWTYTHHNLSTQVNINRLIESTKKGFVINASTEDLKTADKRLEQGLQTVSVIPSDDPRIEKYKGSDNKTYYKQKEEIRTPKGVKGVLCPAQRFENEKINCKNCKLCSKVRDYPIIFVAHGTGVKKANQALKGVQS
jgi:hypothetical protein